MKAIRTICMVGLCLQLTMGTLSFAEEQPDTPENRLAIAQQYTQVQPLLPLVEDTLKAYANMMPEENRQAFMASTKSRIDIQALETLMLSLLAKHFTVKELSAMVGFYGSPEGQAISKKMPLYTAEFLQKFQPLMVQQMQDMLNRMDPEEMQKFFPQKPVISPQ